MWCVVIVVVRVKQTVASREYDKEAIGKNQHLFYRKYLYSDKKQGK
jgi:hypothetical protein